MVATAQNTNNTTIRSILQQDKLIGPNFTNWFQNLRIVLKFEGKLVHLEQPIAPLPYPVASQAARDAYEALYDAQNEVACLMLGSILVQERYDTTSPEGYDLLLWGDLKILFEPNEEDEIWKNQQDYNLISWRLFDSCGIHMLLMHTGIAIHMMIEKKYPLTQEMLSRMLSRRLEVDQESEMAFELLRFIRSQLQQ
ncbi:hypothetical protein Tco_0569623 [Tanacetum coccineum]